MHHSSEAVRGVRRACLCGCVEGMQEDLMQLLWLRQKLRQLFPSRNRCARRGLHWVLPRSTVSLPRSDLDETSSSGEGGRPRPTASSSTEGEPVKNYPPEWVVSRRDVAGLFLAFCPTVPPGPTSSHGVLPPGTSKSGDPDPKPSKSPNWAELGPCW